MSLRMVLGLGVFVFNDSCTNTELSSVKGGEKSHLCRLFSSAACHPAVLVLSALSCVNPRGQHFCWLCFSLYLRSPSRLSSLSHSCMREQSRPVVGMFRWVSNSRVPLYSALSGTMGLNVCCRVHTRICQVIWFLRSQ